MVSPLSPVIPALRFIILAGPSAEAAVISLAAATTTGTTTTAPAMLAAGSYRKETQGAVMA